MRTLALINETKDIKEVLAEAIKYNRAVLEVLFVHEEGLFDLPELFKPEYEQDENIDKEAIKKEILNTLNELKYQEDVAVFVYYNDTYSRVENLLKSSDTLIVTKYNTSTKELLDSRYKILFLKKSMHNYQKVLVELALDGEDKQRIELAKELFPNKELILAYDYNHYIAIDTLSIDPTVGLGYDPLLDETVKKENKKAFNKILQDTSLNGVFLEDAGEVENLVKYINNEVDIAILKQIDSDIVENVSKDCLVI